MIAWLFQHSGSFGRSKAPPASTVARLALAFLTLSLVILSPEHFSFSTKAFACRLPEQRSGGLIVGPSEYHEAHAELGAGISCTETPWRSTPMGSSTPLPLTTFSLCKISKPRGLDLAENQHAKASSRTGADRTRFPSGGGKYREAVKRLRELKKTRPFDVSLRLALLDAYFKAGMNSDGARATQELLDFSALSLAEGQLLVKILVEDKQTQAVEQALRKLVSRWPGSAAPHAELGLLLSERSQFRPAVWQLGWAAQLEPGSAKYNLALAQTLLKWGHYSTALDFLKAVQGRFGELANFQYFLAFSYYGLRRDDRSISVLSKLLRQYPHYAQADYLLGNCYKTLGDTRRAADSFRKAIRLKPNRAPYYVSLAEIEREHPGSTDEAVAYAKKAVKLAPSTSEAKFELALCYESDRDYAHAQVLLEQITRAHPQLVPPHRVLARVYYREGKIPEAKRQTKIAGALEMHHRKPLPMLNGSVSP
jgi:tetratricopeptide (TPR) repeat protein